MEMNKEYTYRQLCEEAGVEPRTSGKAYRSQYERLCKDYAIEKIARNKYIVTEILNPEEYEYQELKGKYLKPVQMILYSVLAKYVPDIGGTFTMDDLLLRCGFINDDYIECKYNLTEASCILCTQQNMLAEYLVVSAQNLRRLLRDILKKLEKRGYIILNKQYKFYKERDGYKQYCVVPFNSQITKDIVTMETRTFEGMGFNDISEIYRSDYLASKFHEVARRKFREMQPDWDGYFKVYNIIAAKESLAHQADNLRQELNESVQLKLLKTKTLDEIPAAEREKFIRATIDLKRPYKIKEKIIDIRDQK